MLPSTVNSQKTLFQLYSLPHLSPLVISSQDPDIHSFFYNYFRSELPLNTLITFINSTWNHFYFQTPD